MSELVVPSDAELLMTGTTKYLWDRVLHHESQTGTSIWSAGWMYMRGDARFVNEPGALLELNAGAQIGTSLWSSGSVVFENLGTLLKTGGNEFYVESNVDFVSTDGVLDIDEGWVELRGFDQSGGSWDVGSGTYVDISWSPSGGVNEMEDVAVTGDGYVQFRGGTTRLFGPGSSYELPRLYVNGGTADLDVDVVVDELYVSSGTLTGDGDMAVNDLFQWSGGWVSGNGSNELVVPLDARLLMTNTTKY